MVGWVNSEHLSSLPLRFASGVRAIFSIINFLRVNAICMQMSTHTPRHPSHTPRVMCIQPAMYVCIYVLVWHMDSSAFYCLLFSAHTCHPPQCVDQSFQPSHASSHFAYSDVLHVSLYLISFSFFSNYRKYIQMILI